MILASVALLSMMGPASLDPSRPQFGVNIHFISAPDSEYKKIRQTGFDWIRKDVFWREIETAPGKFEWAAYDKFFADLERNNLRPLIIVGYRNTLYMKDNVMTPAAMDKFAVFAGKLAERYKGRGIAWEIWNEPDTAKSWFPKPSARQYMQLVKKSSREMKRADPKAFVMGPSLGHGDASFFEETLADGLLDSVDAVSVHPYRTSAPETVWDDYRRFAGLIEAYTPKGKTPIPLINSEWGYFTKPGSRDEITQANFVERMFLLNIAARIPLNIYYDWKNGGEDPMNTEHNYGLLTSKLLPKVVYPRLKDLLSKLRDLRFVARLSTNSGWRLLFQKPTGRFEVVSWKSDPTSRPVWQDVAPSDANKAGYAALAQGKPFWESDEYSRGWSTSNSVRLEPDSSVGQQNDLYFIQAPKGKSLGLLLPTPIQPELLRWGVMPRDGDSFFKAQARLMFVSLEIQPDGGAKKKEQIFPADTRLINLGKKIKSPFTFTIATGKQGDSDKKTKTYEARPLRIVDVMRDGWGKPGISNVFTRVPTNVGASNFSAPVDREVIIKYQLEPLDFGLVELSPTIPLPSTTKGFGFWVKSEMGNAFLRVRLQDVSGETFQVEVGQLKSLQRDTDGWSYASINLSELKIQNFWGGDQNGRLDLPIRIAALGMLELARDLPKESGVIVFGDGVSWQKVENAG